MTSQPDTELAVSDIDPEEAAVAEILRLEAGEANPEVVDEVQPDNEEDDAQEEQELAPAPKAKVKVGDEEVEIDELVAGYMKDGDYRRKTAEIAEVKRTTDAAREQIAAERNHYANRLDVLLTTFEAELIGDQQELAKLASENPALWVQENAKFQTKVQKYNQGIAERQRIGQQQAYEQQQSYNNYLITENQRLTEALPSWKDPVKRQADEQAIAETLSKKYGYTEQELGQIADSRAVRVARDAMLWQRHLATVGKKATTAPPTPVKPGAAPQNSANSRTEKDLAQRLKRTGNVDDAVALLMSRK